MSSDGRTLSWGVKQSFRSYVEGAGGSIEVGQGAERAADGTFTFPGAPGGGLKVGAGGKPEGVGDFAGEVRFAAHGGMLDVFIADPRVEIGPAGATVSVADSQERDRRVALADLDLAAASTGPDGVTVIPARLSRDGWQVLGDHYLPGTPIDPVRLTLTRR